MQANGTQVQSADWGSYTILTFSEVPPVEVVLIDRPGAPFLGTGEASQGPTSAALANAVFDAVGVRFRRLPLTPERVLQGLRGWGRSGIGGGVAGRSELAGPRPDDPDPG